MLIEARQDQLKDSRSIAIEPPSAEAIEEINAYIAIRDGLLDEAERVPTLAKLKALSTANDFVTTCLRPAKAPYGAQFLPEREASYERKRCEGVRRRAAEMRAMIALPTRRAA